MAGAGGTGVVTQIFLIVENVYIMLKIENRGKLLDEIITINGDKQYRIYNIVEKDDHYAIYLTQHSPVMLILNRNKVVNENGHTYDYYTMYDSDIPNNAFNLSKGVISGMDTFMNAIRQILEMK